jgi:glycosyltransferase involved in cell wall biosynthesis
MIILSVAYHRAPVGPEAVGGAECVLGDLDQAVVASGNTSLVVACRGSRVAGELYAAGTGEFQAAIDNALASRRVDAIHLHGLDFHQYHLPERIPTVVTLHLPLAWYPQDAWARFSEATFVCVSQAQWRARPPELSNARVIVNGVDARRGLITRERDGFAVCLGRICPEKNQHQALEAGTLAGVQVLLGGRVFPYPEHLDYFREKVAPLLGGPLGHDFAAFSQERKWEVLSRARCLLHPTLAPETSSLVAMEAMAAGTPVIAYRSGALPEIVQDGVTGFLVSNPAEMAAAMRRAPAIAPEACRARAVRLYDSKRMANEYIELYREVRAKEARWFHA